MPPVLLPHRSSRHGMLNRILCHLTDHSIGACQSCQPASAGTSATISPKPAVNRSLRSTLCSILTPRSVSKCHLADSAAARPLPSSAYAETNPSCLYIFEEFAVQIHHLAVYRQIVSILCRSAAATSLFPAFFSSGVTISCSVCTCPLQRKPVSAARRSH